MEIDKNIAFYEYEIKKSRFIGLIYKVSDSKEIEELKNNLWKEHKRARHICYAYKIDNEIRGFDDGEPKGTASIPLINAIQNNNLNNVAFFIIRYFGGIKLGVGGLYRAYNKTILESIKMLNI